MVLLWGISVMKIAFIDLPASHQGRNQITLGNLHINVFFTLSFTIAWIVQYSDFFWGSLILYSLLMTELGPLRNPGLHSALLLKWPLHVFGNFFLSSFFCVHICPSELISIEKWYDFMLRNPRRIELQAIRINASMLRWFVRG